MINKFFASQAGNIFFTQNFSENVFEVNFLANKNKNLNSAAKAKKDEFYTRIEDIENECQHYKNFFRNKIIFCNCDDPFESNFFAYFAMNFNAFGLKKLIASSYVGSPIIQTEFNFDDSPNKIENFDAKKDAIKVELTEFKDWNGDGREDLYDVQYFLKNRPGAIQKLQGTGDFRSPESVEMLMQADIVVTNPPFSLFREYVKQLIDFDKKFLIIGNVNAITYKEIFPLIKENKIWLGYGFRGMVGFFKSPYEDNAKSSQHREGFIRNSGVHWFTNLDIKKRHEDILLWRSYADEPELYPKYDNYDAIEVSKTADIPKDYFGVMGVPITFLDKYNPEQFEIIGNAGSYGIDGYSLCPALYINGEKIYKRILIRRR